MDRAKGLLVGVTISRILFTVLIIVFYKNVGMVLLFIALALISDFADGRVARKYGISSTWGGALDGVVDKICVLLLVIAFFSIRDVSYIFFPVIFFREILQGIALGFVGAKKKLDYQANWHSKITTNLQALAMFGLVLDFALLFYVLLPFVFIFGGLSVYGYWKVFGR
tara:strand:+ start:2668 stop:3171 length:504 start_codon:yes stop_codon:yes gene_type:complete